MISSVYLSSNFSRQLKRLHQAGGTAKGIAEHAEAIIQKWVSSKAKNPRQLNRNTRYGEARIKNCFKYDLVEAYRLLAVMDGESLFFLFVGSHDECDQWLCHNKGREPALGKRGMKVLAVESRNSNATAEIAATDEDQIDDHDLLREINERDLRIIFSGICRARVAQKPSESVMRSGQ